MAGSKDESSQAAQHARSLQLPSTSVTQMAGTLAGWMGLSAAEIPYVLPNVGNFAPGGLGFV